MNNRCVYIHKDMDGIVRYVGSGTIRRAYKTHAKSSRGEIYANFVNLHGKLNVEILESNLTPDQAIQVEIDIYNKYIDSGTLLNMRKPYKVKNNVEASYLKSILEYDENSKSCLRWKINKSSNARAGEQAGGLNSLGYFTVSIDCKRYLAHRIVMMLHGFKLKDTDVIDHIDGDKSNNKISNLKVTDQEGNARNRVLSKNNTTGVMGVGYDKLRNQYFAMVLNPVTKKYLSRFFSVKKYGEDLAFKLAIEARERLLREISEVNGINFSERHGK